MIEWKLLNNYCVDIYWPLRTELYEALMFKGFVNKIFNEV